MKLNRSQNIILIFLIIGVALSLWGVDYYFIPAAFFVVWLIHMLKSISEGFMIRKMFVIFLALQYCLGSTLSYEFTDPTNIYRMVVPSSEYFSYSFPAVLLMSFGLFIGTNKSDEDTVFRSLNLSFNELKINDKLITGMMFFSVITNYILEGTGLPEALVFIFYLIFGLKYAYVCYQIITKPKINFWLLAIPILYILLQSLRKAMFHDLVTWGIFWGLAVCIRLKPKVQTVVFSLIAFTIFVALIQVSKKSYRQKTWGTEAAAGVEEAGFSTFTNTVKTQTEKGDIANDLSDNIMRINQGWILCRSINFVPAYTEFAGMDLVYKYLESAFLPRIWAPDKLSAGSRDHFMKYTGVEISEGTSMGMGILADGWVAFGQVGGWLLVFFYGLIINISLKIFQRIIPKYPLLYFFMPLVYYYPIRPDCETQTSFGHLVKSMFFLIVMAYLLLPKRRLVRKSFQFA